MPRQRRFTKLHTCHHVMLRGNGGQLIFSDDQDKAKFCLYLQNAVIEYEMVIHAYCFMNNHVHLILEPTKNELSKCVHAFAASYAQYFNRRHELRGHLFQDRFHSILVEDGTYLMRVVRYIHLNPVRANLVLAPQDYIWSSYCPYIGVEENPWLEQKRVLRKFGNTYTQARKELVLYTSRKMDAELDVSIVRESNQIAVFGGDQFLKEVLDLSFECKKSKIKLNDLIAVATAELGFNFEEIVSISREKRLVDARSILALAVKKIPELNLKDLEQYLKRDPSSVCRLIARARQSEKLSNQAIRLVEMTLATIGDGSCISA